MSDNENNDPYAAVYHDEQITDYMGNPLIEALPPELSQKQRMTQLQVRPPLPTAKELEQPAHHRFHYVGRIRDLVLPLPEYHLFEPHVSMMIRRGYLNRNPVSQTTWAKVWRTNVDRNENRQLPSNTTPAESILFCGLSGTGKSTFIKRILSSYPQIIQHTEYKGQPLRLRQISWIKVDCPRDATPIGLCKNFFAAMDRLLGTTYSQEVYSKYTAPDYMNLMGRIASNNFLGVLVLDELQNLSISKSGGEKGLLDQLAAMFEALEIPIIGIGTPRVTRIFEKKLQNVRRSASLGCQWFIRPESADEEAWKKFMSALWEYQWIPRKANLTSKLSAAFFDHCQGITFFAIAMFTHCQYRLINEGDEDTIDTDLLDDIADNELRLLQPALAALRSKDARALENFEDLMLEAGELQSLLAIPIARSRAPKVSNRTTKVSRSVKKKAQSKKVTAPNSESMLSSHAKFIVNLLPKPLIKD